MPVSRGLPAADYPVLAEPVPEQGAVSSFPHGTVFIFDHNLRYTHVGGEHLTALGRSRSDYVGKTLWQMFDDAAVAVREPAYRLALSGENVTLDAPLNDDRVLEMHLSPLVDGDGRVVAAMGYTLDVTELRADAQNLRDSQEQFRLAFEKAPIGMALVRLDGVLFRVNSALTSILGTDEQSLIGATLDQRIHPDFVGGHQEQVQSLLTSRVESFQSELALLQGAGQPVWVLLTASLVRGAHHEPSHLIAQITDITERRAQQEQIAQAHAFEKAVLSASPDLIHVRDVGSARVRWASRTLTDMLGYTAQDLAGLGDAVSTTVIPAEDRSRFEAASVAAQGVADGQVVQIRHRAIHADGTVRWLSRRLTPFRRDESGLVTQLLGVSRDITDTISMEEQLQRAATHDDLTGLPNRRLIHERLTLALSNLKPAKTAVLFCDLDGFKAVNDQHGHPVGDAVLRAAAARMTTAIRDHDTLGRLGGDEFIVVLRIDANESAATVANTVANRIRQALAPPVTIRGSDPPPPVLVTASIGIALPQQGEVADNVLQHADQAMYRAKAAGKNQQVIHGLQPPT